MFMHKIWPGRRAHWLKYENTNNSDFDCMSLASFCQSRAELFQIFLNTKHLSPNTGLTEVIK